MQRTSAVQTLHRRPGTVFDCNGHPGQQRRWVPQVFPYVEKALAWLPHGLRLVLDDDEIRLALDFVVCEAGEIEKDVSAVARVAGLPDVRIQLAIEAVVLRVEIEPLAELLELRQRDHD